MESLTSTYHDEEAESLFLGCLLLDPSGIRLFVDQVAKEDLSYKNGLIWQGMCDLVLDQIMPDPIELKSFLAEQACGTQSSLAAIGGEKIIRQLVDGVAEAGIANTRKAESFALRIERATERRLMRKVAAELEQAAIRPGTNPQSTWNNVIEQVIQSRRGKQKTTARGLRSFASVLEEKLEAWWHGKVIDKTPTGLWTLDQQLGGGLGRRHLTILAGAPGSWKTTLVEEWMQNQAENGFVVGMSSVEMAGEDLLLRMVTRNAGVDLTKLTAGQFNVDHPVHGGLASRNRARVNQELARLGDLQIYIDERPVVSTAEIYFSALTLSLQHGLDVWYIDFADLVQEDAEDTGERIKAVFRRSKEIARLLGIPVVVLSQVRKDVEKRADKKPRVDDVLYRGHDVADAVLLCWDVYGYAVTGDISEADLGRYSDKDGRQQVVLNKDTMYVVVGKTRFGAKGTFALRINRELRSITDPSGVIPRSYMRRAGIEEDEGF